MANNKLTTKQKIKNFFKRNSYTLVVAGSAVIIALSLVLTAVMRSRINEQVVEETNTNIEQVSPKEEVEASSTAPVVFVYPVKNYTMGNTYTDTDMVYNSTLNEYTTHQGIDFIVAEGSEVVAVYTGTVESISYDTLNGTKIVIDHGNGLKTSYGSLSSEIVISEGEKVESGQVIGYASTSATGEAGLGAHLHFEASENGTIINPMKYLGEK